MQDTVLYIAIGLLVVFILLLFHIEIRFKKLFAGKHASTLEEIINEMSRNITEHNKLHTETRELLNNHETRIQKSIQSVRTMRFNPFQDSGSNQSFAIVMTNEKGDGVVLSSLYGRERMSVYAKPLSNFESEHELSDEEQRIVDERKKLL